MLLLNDIEQAMQDALENKRYYQASQLFPVLVHYDKNYFNKYKDTFMSLINKDDRIKFNIEEVNKIMNKPGI